MAGAIIQLVAHGVQDLYLTSDPQITFFKLLYRRHTNFSVESVIQKFNSIANFGEIVTATISRIGDLIEQIFVYVQIPLIPKFILSNGNDDLVKKIAWVTNLGYALVQEVSIEIGGKLIDKQYGEWLYLWSQVTCKQSDALNKMIGNVKQMFNFSNGKKGYELYIPLEFWFNKYCGLSLPIVALASSDVKISIKFRKLEECIRIGPTHSIEVIDNIVPFKPGDYIEQTINNQVIHGYFIDFDYLRKKIFYIKIQSPSAIKKQFDAPMLLVNQSKFNSPVNQCEIHQINLFKQNPYRIYNSLNNFFVNPKPGTKELIENTDFVFKLNFINCYLYVNYIYLDKEERLKFCQSNHQYLIEQIQYNTEIGIKSSNLKQKLNLNHPCKAHYWIAQLDCLVGPRTINDLFNFTSSHIRYPDGSFYGTNLIKTAVLQLDGHDRFCIRDGQYFNWVQPFDHQTVAPIVGINMYSFSLNLEEFQPSSTMNMSEINEISMLINLVSVINPQNTCKIRSYTPNYNILRICFNLGCLAFV